MIPRSLYQCLEGANCRQAFKNLDRTVIVAVAVIAAAVMAGGVFGGEAKAALMELGKPGGLLYAKDNLAAGPVALIVDPSLSVNNPNHLEPFGAPRATWVPSTHGTLLRRESGS